MSREEDPCGIGSALWVAVVGLCEGTQRYPCGGVLRVGQGATGMAPEVLRRTPVVGLGRDT